MIDKKKIEKVLDIQYSLEDICIKPYDLLVEIIDHLENNEASLVEAKKDHLLFLIQEVEEKLYYVKDKIREISND